jgi:hypothetical protein
LSDKLRRLANGLTKFRFESFYKRMIGGVGWLGAFRFFLDGRFWRSGGRLFSKRFFNRSHTRLRLLDHRCLFGVGAGEFARWRNRCRGWRAGRLSIGGARLCGFFGNRFLGVF